MFSIGHGISSLFGGGSAAAVDQVDPVLQAQAQEPVYGRACEGDARTFTKCLDENRGEHAMSICGWYFDQLVCFIIAGFIAMLRWCRKLASRQRSLTRGDTVAVYNSQQHYLANTFRCRRALIQRHNNWTLSVHLLSHKALKTA